MSIPFNDNLLWGTFQTNPNWHVDQPVPAPKPLPEDENQTYRAVNAVSVQTFKQGCTRSIQFIRDAARLVLKVPIRAVWTPIILPKNWRERERAKINAKLTGYAFVQLAFVPAKFTVALAALATSALSYEKAQWLLDMNEHKTAYLDGCASQLEALKEVGAKGAANRGEYDRYKAWLYNIEPKLCRK